MSELFWFRERRGRVEVAFTAAQVDGQVLNLALPGTPPAAVGDPVADLARVAEALGVPDLDQVCGMHQVHGAEVARARPGASMPTADALVADGADATDLLLLVRTADCVPVLLADVERGVTAAVHAGRPGLAAGVVPTAVAAARDAGAGELTAWIGPHVCGSCYEVPAQLQEEVAQRVPQSRARTSWGRPRSIWVPGSLLNLRPSASNRCTWSKAVRVRRNGCGRTDARAPRPVGSAP